MSDVALSRLPDPDAVGTSEYRALYELISIVAEGAISVGDDPAECVSGSLDELRDDIGVVRSLLFAPSAVTDPWGLTRLRGADYDDWRREVSEGETLRGFAEFVAARDESDSSD